MKTGFQLIGRADSQESTLLLRIALILHERRLIPNRMVSTRVNAQEMKVVADFSPAFAPVLPALVEQLRKSSGIQSVELLLDGADGAGSAWDAFPRA